MHGCSRQAITGRGGKFPASHTFNNSLEIFYPFLGLFPTSLLLGDLILQCCFSCLSLLSDTSPLIFEVFNSFLDLLFTLLHQAYQTFKTTRFIRELGLLFGKLTGKVLNFGQSLGELMGLGWIRGLQGIERHLSRFSSLSERVISSLEFSELSMFCATVFSKLVNLCVELIAIALRLGLSKLQLFRKGVNAKLRDSQWATVRVERFMRQRTLLEVSAERRSRIWVSSFWCSCRASFKFARSVFTSSAQIWEKRLIRKTQNLPVLWVPSSFSLLTTPTRSRFSRSTSSTRCFKVSVSETVCDCEFCSLAMSFWSLDFDATIKRLVGWIYVARAVMTYQARRVQFWLSSTPLELVQSVLPLS